MIKRRKGLTTAKVTSGKVAKESRPKIGLPVALNAEQQKAVTTTEGPLLVLAGAGSGKTRVITYRIAHLIQQQKARPGEILAVTFTNKAAREMRTRVEKLLKEQGAKSVALPLISTFHSFCARLLRRDIDKLPKEQGHKYTRDFTIYDADDQEKLIKHCLKDLDIDEKLLSARSVQAAISGAKSKGETWQSMAAASKQLGNNLKKEAKARIFKLYEEKLKRANALDFDDLLLKAVQLLRSSKETRDYYNQRFRYILIDEYQDTNPPQLALVRLLTEKHQNICVVGDPDQSIYRFRSADIKNILDFEKYYPKAQIIKLTQNYRSTKTILTTANDLIRNNIARKEKDLHTENEAGEKVRYYQAFSGEDEAEFVAKKIRHHLKQDPGTRCVVLYRINAQSRLFEEACRREKLRYSIVGGFSFYQRAEVKDIIAYLKLLLNPHDNIALERVLNTPPRGIGKITLETIATTAMQKKLSYWEVIKLLLKEQTLPGRALNALAAFHKTIEQLSTRLHDEKYTLTKIVKAAIVDTGYQSMLKKEKSVEAEGRLENLEELVSAAAEAEEREETLRDFIDHAAMVAAIDALQDGVPVTLMTVHSAKGLEFPIVFLAGMEQGLFPHSRSLHEPEELEEERRLCYVAITRAQKHLYITHAQWRRTYGEENMCQISQFLTELPLEVLEDHSSGQSWLKKMMLTDSRKKVANAKPGKIPDSTKTRIRKRIAEQIAKRSKKISSKK